MFLDNLLQNAHLTKYKAAKLSNIPQTTISDIFSGKTRLSKCSAETVYKLSRTLNVSMERLMESELNRPDFEIFKNNICHLVKALGDVKFIVQMLEKDEVTKLYENGWYAECLYLLAMVDYLSRKNDIPLYNKYEHLRTAKLKKTIYPSSVIAISVTTENNDMKEQVMQNSIPEFARFNIVESEIGDVC